MENQFGTLLKNLSVAAGVKAKELSEASNYDTTYISKWINGVKLPAKNNIEEIVDSIGDYLSEKLTPEKWRDFAIENHLQSDEEEPDIREAVKKALFSAYGKDRTKKELEIGIGETTTAFFDDKREVMNLIGAAFHQVNETKTEDVTIASSFDLFNFLGSYVHKIMNLLDPGIVKNLRLLQELEPEDAMKNYEFYCSTILDTIIEHEHVELNFFAIKPENPKIIIINDYLLVHVLEDDAGTFSAFCTMDKRIIDHFNKYFDSLANRREAILSYAAAESMRNTNVQLDSYADSCQTELFNEAPAMLLPTNIMEKLAAGSENEEYGEYLFKLSNIFEKYTSKSDVTLIVYNSVMNEYVHDGNLSIGNVPHRLTREEVRQHIGHLSDIMAENCNFKMFAIRDTVHMGTATKYRPSIFIDQHAVTIENSKRRPNESYHISMNSFFIKMFGKYIGDIEGQANCTQLTRTDLERYL